MSMSTSKLNAAILAVCPIDGVAKLNDGTYRIDYRVDATPEQRAAAQAVVDAWPLHEARAAAVARVQAGYDAAIAAGITPQGSQITLAAAETDQNAFTRQATLLREAQEMGLVNDATQQVIVDAAGVAHTLTIAQLRALLVGYGLALKALFDVRAAKRAQAQLAESIEDAAAITW
jgi:hypothetical protein